MSKIDSFSNNCTLVAVREVCHATEDEILEAFRACGYVENQGMHTAKWWKAAEKLGVDMQPLKYSDLRSELPTTTWRGKMNLKEFCETYSTGVYFVSTCGHAFVVRNGVVVDPNVGGGFRKEVYSAARVLNPKAQEIGERVKFNKWPGWGKSAARTRRRHVWHWINQYHTDHGRHPRKDEVLKNTLYTEADFKWDLKRGVISLVEK